MSKVPLSHGTKHCFELNSIPHWIHGDEKECLYSASVAEWDVRKTKTSSPENVFHSIHFPPLQKQVLLRSALRTNILCVMYRITAID